MTDKEEKQLERYKSRLKRQNDAIKETYDRISCTLPKGTKDRITGAGYTVNGLINSLVRR